MEAAWFLRALPCQPPVGAVACRPDDAAAGPAAPRSGAALKQYGTIRQS